MNWHSNRDNQCWLLLNGADIFTDLTPLIIDCCRKIFLYSDSSPNGTDASLSLVGRKADHSVGAIVWGRESTAAYLFASSEPHGDEDFNGFHKGFDVEAQKVAFDFDVNEAGDAITITQDGQGVLIAICCSLSFLIQVDYWLFAPVEQKGLTYCDYMTSATKMPIPSEPLIWNLFPQQSRVKLTVLHLALMESILPLQETTTVLIFMTRGG
jgi:hypothetical protein